MHKQLLLRYLDMLNKLYIANWKMYLSHTQASAWLQAHGAEIAALAKENTIVICPDFTLLPNMHGLLYGAQNCAAEQAGAYTGEISAQTLKELGCSYCIVGHSERRTLFGETTQECAKKITLLQENGIIPIYCIGEQEQSSNPYAVLKSQLDPVLQEAPQHLIVAYEPVWAIGTGKTPPTAFLTEVVTWIKEYIPVNFPVIYGGSVTEVTIRELKSITIIDGFLIGKASTDFQQLKKIVLS